MLKTSQQKSLVLTAPGRVAVTVAAIYWRPSMRIDLRQAGGWGMKSS